MIKRYVQLAGSAQIRTVQARGFVSIPWFSKNYQQINFALKNPDKIDSNGRLGAVVATQKYNPNEVGYGVHAATILIYFVFRDLGEQGIGRKFSQPYVVEILESPRNYKNNWLLAIVDQGHWIFHQGKGATLPDNIVICIGAWIYPLPRAVIQEILAKIRENFFKTSS